MRIPGSCMVVATLALALGGCTSGVTIEPGPPDAGSPDIGPPDAGPPDAGPPACDASCGSLLWSLDLGGSYKSMVTAVGADASGNVIIEALFQGAPNTLGVPEPMPGQQTVLAKLDPTGHVLWAKALPSAANWPLMTVGADGSIVLFGSIYAGEVLDLGGGPLSPAGPGLTTMYVAELDPSGHHVMSRALHEVTADPSSNLNDFASPTVVALDPSGAIIVVGEFVGALNFGDGELGVSPATPATSDVFVLKLDPSGALLWSQRFGTALEMSYASGTESSGVAVDAEGSILLSITLYGAVDLGGQTITSAGHADILVAKLDPSGSLMFVDWFGGPDFDIPGPIATGPDGAIFFTGLVTDTVDFGGVSLASPGGLGGPFVTALEPDGHVRWSVLGPAISGGFGQGIAVDGAGNVEAAFISSLLNTQIALAKLDPSSGTTTDARTIALADPSDPNVTLDLRGFAVDPLGNVLLGGGFRGVVDFGNGPLTMNSMYDPALEGDSAFLAKVAP